MSDLLKKPNIEKVQGDRLSYSEINALDNAIDSIVDVINRDLKSYCNVNYELTGTNPDLMKEFSLSSAILLIDVSRRCKGFIIKFLEEESKVWVEYQYMHDILDLSSWKDVNNWKRINPIQIIDGGTF